MDLNIRLMIDAPRGWKRRALLYVALPIALVAATGVVAYAVPNDFSAGDKLSASKINGNFADLEAQIAAAKSAKPILTKNGKQYSTSATYCGATAPKDGEQVGGYAGAKAACEAATVCNSPSAHMCTSEEIVRSMQVGVNDIPQGWYSSASWSYNSQSNSDGGDCQGWMTKAAARHSLMWDPALGGRSDISTCEKQRAVLCCD